MNAIKRTLVAVTVGASVLTVAGCAGRNDAHGAGGRYDVFLSNNYMGNEWRPQMVNQAVAAADSADLKDKVDLQVRNVDLTPAQQISSLQGIIRQKPDAILVDAASPTALNPTLEQACKAGITVVTFDQIADTPCAYKLPQDYAAEAEDMVHWLGTVLKGRGNILMDTGLPGLPISTTFVNTWKRVLASDYPGIKVVGTYSSQYAPGPELEGVSNALAQNAHIDGILSGGYITSQVKAFQAAGRKPVPATGLDINGNMQTCEKLHLPCFYIGAPSFVSAMALQEAVKILDGDTSVPKSQVYWSTNYVSTAGDVTFDHVQKVEAVKAGSSYFPNLSPSLVVPFTNGPSYLTADVALGK
jgi:ribose transport system substrate-binding protein